MMYIETQALYKDPFKPVTVIVTAVAQRDLYRAQEKSLRLCGPFSSLHPLSRALDLSLFFISGFKRSLEAPALKTPDPSTMTRNP